MELNVIYNEDCLTGLKRLPDESVNSCVTFPPDLIVDCIKAGSPRRGVILDPFMGVGTTAMVARKLERNYIGFEINPEYLKITEKRLQYELGLFR